MLTRFRLSIACVAATAVVAVHAYAQQGTDGQIADPDFKPSIAKPSYSRDHPAIVLDEAHANFHTAAGRYKPFVDVVQADGYRVVAGTQPFTSASLANARVLVIANAVGTQFAPGPEPPSAFSDAECDAVRDWVRAGGSLLLIADHTPFGATAFALAQRFGVEMGKGYAWTPDEKREPSTTVTYARGSGLATNHPITRGLRRVVAFTGQSLSVPPGATALLTFGDVAYESTAANGESDVKAFREGKPFRARKITGRAQALAFAFGKGRVVMTGEAAMFSAQVVRFTDQGKPVEFKMGMNVPGNDNQQFLLNIMRWLTSLPQ